VCGIRAVLRRSKRQPDITGIPSLGEVIPCPRRTYRCQPSWSLAKHRPRVNNVAVAEFDQIAEHYDETRGGEQRGDEYAADIDAFLPPHEGPILEIGVGTGVVALGLRRRGRTVLGLDVSGPMMARAFTRLGPSVVRCDAMQMSIATAGVAHATSVWVVHSVREPIRLFQEAARVIRPGGTYVVCSGQRPSPEDRVGRIIADLGARIDARRRASRPRRVSVDEVIDWAGSAGFTGEVHSFERQWRSSPDEELKAISYRTWPTLRELDEEAIEEVTRPAIEALKALPVEDEIRRATSEMVVLRRP
jgi:ubiquinone/menaquinone biosynthesis C-methylase UbiE